MKIQTVMSEFWQFILLVVCVQGTSALSQESDSEMITNSIGMQFKHIPAGEFIQGFDNSNRREHQFDLAHLYSNAQNLNFERPAHRVEITNDFMVGIHEVRVRDFRKFVAATGYVTEAEQGAGGFGFFSMEKDYVDRFQKKSHVTWQSPGFDQTEQHPVVVISWNDAKAFCEWLSQKENALYRLPTESEWEYACRAGTTTWYSWGTDPDLAYTTANVADATLEALAEGSARYQRALKLKAEDGDGFALTAPVGSFIPNSWGLFDMHGNVWEWCEDRWDEEAYEKRLEGLPHYKWKERLLKDPLNRDKTAQHDFGDWRVIRGGGWTCAPASCRTTIRTYAEASDAAVYTGFRIVKEIK